MVFDIVMLWLHTLVAVSWIGGMVFNLFVVRPSITVISAEDRIKLALTILRQFIPLVWLCVLVLASSGIYLSVLKVGSLQILMDSYFGGILLLKLIIVAVMVSIVAFIRYNRLPLLESLEGSPELGRVLGGVVSLVRLNLALGAVVLLLSGILAFS
jgi:uncharacterized membrane protein